MEKIKYKLYKPVNESLATQTQVLTNRGIPREEVKQWLQAGWESIYGWEELDFNNMQRGCAALAEAIEEEQDIAFLVDCDCDGMSAASLVINYLFSRVPDYVVQHISWTLHEGKAHGLADTVDIFLEQKPAIVFCFDSASNDIEQHKQLIDAGIQVFCGDHHECSQENYENSPAIIVNVQTCDYPNKALTGAGVAYKFISAFEDLYIHGNQPEEFMDLCALGNIGDMSSYKEMETRAIVNIGLKNIKNPFFVEMARTNDFSIQKMNGINYYSVAFYIVPYINAICRSATMEEKEVFFEGMLTQTAFKRVESSKRGEKGVQVPLYQEAVVVAQRVKRRQTKLQDEAMENIERQIKEKHLADNAIILVEMEPNECEASLCGLISNKIQAKYQHPAMVLRRTKPADSSEYIFSGSLRNYSLCSIQNFASLCRSTGIPEFVAGHEGAAGIAIKESLIPRFIKATNELYKDVDFTPTYWVDYIWKPYNIDSRRILDLGELNIYGQEIPESLIVVEDIVLDERNVTLMGKNRNAIKIMCGNVACILFQTNEDTYQDMISGNKTITIVGKGNCNEWNGNISPQIIIEDYEITQEEWIF